jgi:hypothetical protein
MPAKAGIQLLNLGPRRPGGDELQTLSFQINNMLEIVSPAKAGIQEVNIDVCTGYRLSPV